MPIKDRRVKILLLLCLQDSEQFTPVEITPELQEIFDLAMNQKTKGSLSAMVKDGLIERTEESGTSLYSLTYRGYMELCLEFPFFRFQKEEWDGLWRIISYEIPESQRHLRDSLRRSMRGWGLGPWHRSFWLTPHPILTTLRELVYGSEEAQYVQAFEATHIIGDMPFLVEKVWNKSTLEQTYKNLFKEWHDILSTEQTAVEKYRHIIYAYLRILRDDPGLPASLIGRNWIGFEAYSIFKEIKGILMK